VLGLFGYPKEFLMPLVYTAIVTIDRISANCPEVSENAHTLIPALIAPEIGDGWFAVIDDIKPVKPTKDLSDLIVPLPELRGALAAKMQGGQNSMNLADLLELIRAVYKESKD
jgi:hypothetical protein